MAIDYLPVYFQACMAASPIHSSVNLFATALVMAPSAIVCGVIVKKTNKYRPANYVGWILIMIGFGLLSLLKADSSAGAWAGYQVITAVGVGIIVSDTESVSPQRLNDVLQWASTVFPILAPVPVTRTASALAFYNFCRTFSQV